MKERSEDVETPCQGKTSEGFASEAYHAVRRASGFEKAVPVKLLTIRSSCFMNNPGSNVTTVGKMRIYKWHSFLF